MIKKCFACKKAIDTEKDKYVLLGTYNGTGKAKKDEKFYHFQCFVDWFNQKLVDRISNAQGQAMKMLAGSLKNLNFNIQNG